MTSWRCRRLGWHRWRFVSMSNVREIQACQRQYTVCRLVERCGRCGLWRTQHSAPVPKRPKVST